VKEATATGVFLGVWVAAVVALLVSALAYAIQSESKCARSECALGQPVRIDGKCLCAELAK
jgi:hypothetical protein